MLLNITERNRLAQILPKEGSFKEARVASRVMEAVKIPQPGDDELHGVVEVKDQATGRKTGHIVWNPDLTDKTREFRFDPPALKMVRDALRKLERERQLTTADVSLYEKFMPADEVEPEEPVAEALPHKPADDGKAVAP